MTTKSKPAIKDISELCEWKRNPRKISDKALAGLTVSISEYGRVYLIKNLLNGKGYVGQTIQSLKARWKGHKDEAHGKRLKTAIYSAMRKYGIDSFSIVELEICSSIDEMNEREKYWIEYLHTLAPNGYNLHTGGLNHITSEETRLKQSISAKLKPPITDETRQRLSLANKIRYQNPDEIEKIRRRSFGRFHSKETIEKCSIIARKRFESPVERAKISVALKGKKKSVTHRKKISDRKIELVRTGRHNLAKLDAKKVLQIRQFLSDAELSSREIAALYGVDKNQILAIRDGRAWRWVGTETQV